MGRTIDYLVAQGTNRPLRCGPALRFFVAMFFSVHLVAQENGGDRPRKLESQPVQPAIPSVEVTGTWFPSEVASRGLTSNGAWLPVCVELKSLTAVEEEARIRLTAISEFDEAKGQKFEVERIVAVPPGASRRTWVYVRAAPRDRQTIRIVVNTRDANTAGRPSPSPESTASDGDALVEVDPYSAVALDRALGPADCSDSGGQSREMAALVVGEKIMNVVPDPNWFRDTQFSSDSSYIRDDCHPTRFPTSEIGLAPFGVVILRDLGNSRLDAVQIEALRRWVYLGGNVVVVPSSPTAPILVSEVVRTLLGDDWTEPRHGAAGTIGDVVVYSDGEERRLPGAERSAIVEGRKLRRAALPAPELADPFSRDPKPLDAGGGREFWVIDESQLNEDDIVTREALAYRLYAERQLGAGRVGVVTFDETPFLNSSGQELLRPLWRTILVERSGLALARRALRSAARFQATSTVDRLRDASRDIGFPFIVALVVGYVALVGPGLYFLLRRMGRLTWLVWVEPLFVLVYLGVILGYGYISKGVITKARQWTIIDHRVGESLALRHSYLAVFSGADSDYEVGTPSALLFKPIRATTIPRSETTLVAGPGQRLRLTGIHLDQWEEAYFLAANVDSIEKRGVEVVVEEEDAAAGDDERELAFSVTNHLPHPVQNGVFLFRGSRYAFSSVAPGATLRVEASPFAREDDPLPQGWSDLHSSTVSDGLASSSGAARVVAVLSRDDADYDAEWSENLRARTDLYLQFR